VVDYIARDLGGITLKHVKGGQMRDEIVSIAGLLRLQLREIIKEECRY
jgi:hypothetical protein